MDHARLIASVLEHWPRLRGGALEPLGSGLINVTWLVTPRSGDPVVLQKVNPIFDPAIHDNIHAVAQHLSRAGIPTIRLVPAHSGQLCVELQGGIYRVTTFEPGEIFQRARVELIESAGALLGRIHGALDTLEHEFVGMRLGVHDTENHLNALESALRHDQHRLFDAIAPLAESILEQARRLPPLPSMEPRICHGDPKLNNIVFCPATPETPPRAHCMIDLDTVGPMQLAHELGDAWRSWCNLSGEDDTDARFDLDIFERSLRGYRRGIDRPFTTDEKAALLSSVEWISLELAARFAADALEEKYFGWDSTRFASRADHNLLRARGQWSLHRAAEACRSEREALITAC